MFEALLIIVTSIRSIGRAESSEGADIETKGFAPLELSLCRSASLADSASIRFGIECLEIRSSANTSCMMVSDSSRQFQIFRSKDAYFQCVQELLLAEQRCFDLVLERIPWK